MDAEKLKERAGQACDFRWNSEVVTLADALEAIKAEREACAAVCDEADKNTHPADLAATIRSRAP